MKIRFQYSFVVVIETASNQKTIFQTNRLRENIGASQLVHMLFSTNLRNILRNQSNDDVLPVITSSGKAIFLVREPEIAEKIIEDVTWIAANQCPGVTVRGAFATIADWTANELDRAIADAHLKLAQVSSRLPSPFARFQGLPFVENCAASGYPAAWPDPDPNIAGAISEVGLAKRNARNEGWLRIRRALPGIRFFKNMDKFEDEEIGSDWVGVVHADGNGLGQIFIEFSSHLARDASAEDYLRALNMFSKAVDDWSVRAVKKAIDATWPDVEQIIRNNRKGGKKEWAQIPVIPVVLGGDDLSVICEGERAVRFAAQYLVAFEEASKAALVDGLGGMLPELKGCFIAAAAGVAIVKPHFPFHRAYGLSEQLMKHAKGAKTRFGKEPCSALDYQVIFDSSGAELDIIRERMRAPDGRELTMRPYVVTPMDKLATAAASAQEWAARRHYYEGGRSLHAAIEALLRKPNTPEETNQCLPRSQAYALHEALYLGKEVADGRIAQIRSRYNGFSWNSIAEGWPENLSLFIDDSETYQDGNEHKRIGAYLLDAMELAGLGKEEALGKPEAGA